MNNVIEQLKARTSVRAFEHKKIEESIKEEIINAAFEAPTTGCMMLYTILDITDNDLKAKLAANCDNQPSIEEAPLVLIFLADYQRWYEAFKLNGYNPRKPGEGDIMLACADAFIAAQNTVVAAHSLGIGSCYIGDILENKETISELLNLPEFVIPAAMVVYGYPILQQKNKAKAGRFDKEYIVFENQYRSLTKKEYEDMHSRRNAKCSPTYSNKSDTIEEYSIRKYMADLELEMNRSISEYLNNFRD